MNIVKARFTLDKVEEARKTLFKDTAIEGRPEQSLHSTPLKQRAEDVLRSGLRGRGSHWPSEFAIWPSQKEE